MLSTNVKQTKDKTPERVNFSGSTIYCGLDVHKKSWNTSIYVDGTFVKSFHQLSDENVLLKHLQSNYPGGTYKACYEAGFCGFSVQRSLTSLGIECIVVNAADVPQTNKGILSKTDTTDSRRLGEAFSKGLLKPIYVPAQDGEADRNLIRYRKRLQSDIRSKKNMIKACLNTQGIKIPPEHDKGYWTNNFLLWLDNLTIDNLNTQRVIQYNVEDVRGLRKKMYSLTKVIRELSQNEKYKNKYDKITTAPGIGLIIAMTMLTEIQDINRFDNFNKFNSYIGLCPSEFSSGEQIHKGKMTVRCHKEIRSLLIEGAWVAIRLDPALTKKYNELIKDNRRTKKRAIVVIARKLLSRIYKIWKDDIEYEIGIVK